MTKDLLAHSIDYFDTQLTEEEVVEEMALKEAQDAEEATNDRARLAKARNFRFVGGML